MPTKSFTKLSNEILSKSASSPLALSLLLIALEAVLNEEFTCPCKQWCTLFLITLIFFGPFLMAFAIMFLYFRLCRRTGWDLKKTDEKTFYENLTQCLIPPSVWIIIFLLDGDYVACCAAKLEGNYVFNKELNKKWCQPSEWDPKGNESYLLDYHKSLSQVNIIYG